MQPALHLPCPSYLLLGCFLVALSYYSLILTILLLFLIAASEYFLPSNLTASDLDCFHFFLFLSVCFTLLALHFYLPPFIQEPYFYLSVALCFTLIRQIEEMTILYMAYEVVVFVTAGLEHGWIMSLWIWISKFAFLGVYIGTRGDANRMELRFVVGRGVAFMFAMFLWQYSLPARYLVLKGVIGYLLLEIHTLIEALRGYKDISDEKITLHSLPNRLQVPFLNWILYSLSKMNNKALAKLQQQICLLGIRNTLSGLNKRNCSFLQDTLLSHPNLQLFTLLRFCKCSFIGWDNGLRPFLTRLREASKGKVEKEAVIIREILEVLEGRLALLWVFQQKNAGRMSKLPKTLLSELVEYL